MKDYKRPLQIISVDLKSNEVKVNKEALEEIKGNLREAGVEKISVVSVMGAYRTGKSFLLDLFLRYLQYEEEMNRLGKSILQDNNFAQGNFAKGLDGADAMVDYEKAKTEDERSNGETFKIPEWMSAMGKMGESSNGDDQSDVIKGFSWRGGAAHCTEGIWIWPVPFVRTITVTENISKNEDEEIFAKRKIKVGLLITDTQGAFDSQTTKAQSATIFGLTTALSSKQLYNIQGRIGSDTIENLHYFAEIAVSATRSGMLNSTMNTTNSDVDPGGSPAGGSTSSSSSTKKPFQFLQLLVRDWSCFDDETWEDSNNSAAYNVPYNKDQQQRWTNYQCRQQMKWHCDKHMGPGAKERQAVDTILEMFNEVNCYLLPVPGLKVAESKKRKWDGGLEDIDEDFIRFVDAHCKQIFDPNSVLTQSILGADITPDSFPEVVETLVTAFAGMNVTKFNLVEAIGKAKNLLSKDEAHKRYKKHMDKQMAATMAKTGKDLEELEKDHVEARKQALQLFNASATFGNTEEINAAKIKLEEEMHQSYDLYKQENQRRVEKALSAFAGLACFAILAFVLDKLSDYGCDWYSDTCVQISKMLVLFYIGVLGLVGWQFYQLVMTRGQAAGGVAVIELAKECTVVAHKTTEKAVYYGKNLDVLKKDAQKLAGTIQENYVNPLLTPPDDAPVGNEKKKN